MQNKFIILYIFVLFTGCSKDLKQQEYIQYVRNPINGLAKSVTVNNIDFEIQYEPVDYLALKELRGTTYSEKSFDKVKEKFIDYLYFKMELKSSNGKLFNDIDSTTEEKYDRQLKFHFNDYAFLVDGHDTLKCLMSQYDNTGEVGDRYSIQMIFEKKEIKADSLCFLFIDRIGIISNKEVRITILNSDLKNIPGLKI